jgi:predicted acyl esterase
VDNALPPYPEWSGEDWAWIWEQHIAENEPYLLNWLEHQTDGPYWRNGSVRDIVDRIRCPVLLMDGWRDGYANVALRLYTALQVPKKVIVGPWNHSNADVAVPGPRIDYLHEVLRWLDHWCKGAATGILDEPPVVLYVQEAQRPAHDRLDTEGAWRAEVDWPAPGASERVLFLGSDGRLARAAGEEGADPLEYVATVGVTAGLWSGGLDFGLPGDQRPDEALSLVYTSEPLEEDVHVIGRARAILHVASSASVIGFAASLCDVSPDGVSNLVAKGMLNVTRRSSLTDPEPLGPDEVVELDVDIDATAWVFRQGHRIRLAVANADWPNVWPTPQPATSTVHRGGEHASRLVLPTVPATGSAAAPAFRPSPPTASAPADETDPPRWEVSSDLVTGRSQVRIAGGYDSRINATTVRRRTYSFVADCDPRDPASASARGRYSSCLSRPNAEIQGSSEIVVRATAHEFHVAVDLELRLNGGLHAARRWTRSIPRVLL